MKMYRAIIVTSILALGSYVSERIRSVAADDEVAPRRETDPKAPSQRKYEHSFLFVNRQELGAADRYISVGSIVDGAIVVNRLIKVDRLGYYRVVAQPNTYDLWVYAPRSGNLLCINQANPLVSQMVGNAERILAVTKSGIYFAGDRPRNARELGEPQLYFLDFTTHETNAVPIRQQLGRFDWRAAVMSPDGLSLATVKANPTGTPPDFKVLVEDIRGEKAVSLGPFPFIPRSPISSSFHDNNLLWVGPNRLVVASGTKGDTPTYRLALFDSDTGRQIAFKDISSEEPALSLTLSENDRRGFPYACYGPAEGFSFNKDLSRIQKLEKPEGQSWRIHSLRTERGWPEPEHEMLLASNDGKRYELIPAKRFSSTETASEVYRVAYSMPSPDGEFTYLVLMGLDYDHHEGAILDRTQGTLIKGASYYPIGWLDGPLLKSE